MGVMNKNKVLIERRLVVFIIFFLSDKMFFVLMLIDFDDNCKCWLLYLCLIVML